MDNFNPMVRQPGTHVAVPPAWTNTPSQDFTSMELANPMQSGDVLSEFDFDSFLHDNDGDNQVFDFNGTLPGFESGEIGAE